MRKALFILAELNDGDIRWMAEAGSLRSLGPGDVLIQAGETVPALYVIVAGDVAVQMRDGGEIARMSLGDIVGEMSLVQRRPPDVSVVAVNNVRVLSIQQETLRARLSLEEGFAARFYRALSVFLADRLRENVARLGTRIATPSDASDPETVDEVAIDAIEIDEGALDGVHLAGARMRRLVALLDGSSE